MLKSHVFSYKLQLLNEEKETTVYSATNTTSYRFDVARFYPENVKQRIFTNGSTTAEHTWFPPYEWNFVSCLNCGSHLGWAYYSPKSTNVDDSKNSEEVEEKDSEERLKFFGFILTRLRPHEAAKPKEQELDDLRRQRQSEANRPARTPSWIVRLYERISENRRASEEVTALSSIDHEGQDNHSSRVGAREREDNDDSESNQEL